MKYRILKQVRNNGDLCYTPQVKESFWNKWQPIAKDKRQGYVYLPVNTWLEIRVDYILYALPTLDEAVLIVEDYIKMKVEQDSLKIKSTTILHHG